MNFRVLFAAIVAVLLAVPAFATESVEGATAVGSPPIVDSSGNVWSFGAQTGTNTYKTLQNGAWFGTGAGGQYYYHGHTVYTQNVQTGQWYQAGTNAWSAVSDPHSTNCTGTDWCDDFNSLDIAQHMDPAHKWDYVDTWGPAWDGEAINSTWEVNPLNPATAISGIYGTSGGNLTLNILPTPGTCTTACGGKNNVAASMWSTAKVFQGYTECRMKLLPNINNSTFACWLYGDKSGPTHAYQELDIIESPRAGDGSWNLIAQTIHRGNVAGGQPGTDIGDPTPYYRWSASFDGNFHTYGVDWGASQICYYIDRVQTQCEATPAGYDSPMWLSIGLGDSGSWGGGAINPANLPAQGQVDYVAHWAARPF